MNILTNGHEREFLDWTVIPTNVKREYAHMSLEEMGTGWIKYKGIYRHLSDFVMADSFEEFTDHGWHGYVSDCAFSGVVIKVSDDGETYVIGRYFS